jgi:hypothetical protein
MVVARDGDFQKNQHSNLAGGAMASGLRGRKRQRATRFMRFGGWDQMQVPQRTTK